MTEYRMSKANKAMTYFLAFALVAGGVIMIYFGLHQRTPPLLIAAPLAIALGWLIYYGITRVLVTIDETTITICNGYGTRSMLLDDIAGFRRGEKNGLLLVPKDGGKSLEISRTLEAREELEAWLEERYKDIDAEAEEEVEEEVLHDERYGLTEEERGTRLKRARRIAGIGWVIAGILFFWLLYRPRPFEALMLTTLAIPLAAAWLTWYYKGILRLYSSKEKPYPSLVWAVFTAVAGGWIAIDRRYDIYLTDGRFWGMVLAVSLAVMLVWSAACRLAVAGEKYAFAIYAGIALIAGVYGYDALVFTNCAYDQHEAVTLRAGVNGKHSSSGKSASYYLELSPWGRFTQGSDVEVSRSEYQSVAKGDSVSVYLYSGKWGIPWYEVITD